MDTPRPFRPRSVGHPSLLHGKEDGDQHGDASTGLGAFRKDLRRAWVRFGRTDIGHTRLVLLLLVFGTVLRLLRIGEPVSYDEAITWTHYASQGLWALLADYTSPSNHVLHSVLVKVSTGLFGVHLWSLRLPALLAGLIAMPLCYAFVRAMFNRYIALLALALVAASGPLIEYSALARGYSLSWAFLLCALLAGRHSAKKDNSVSLVLMALSCALGLWTTPSMVYGVVLVYVWLFLYLATTYRRTLRRRVVRLLGSLVLCVALAFFFYAPLISAHGLEHLVDHPSFGDNSWSGLLQDEQDQVFALWAYFTDTATTWIAALGLFAVIYAAYTSTKYRLLLIALLVGTVPVVLLQRRVAPPPVWTYVLFFLHLGSAIGVFYFLKFLQERVSERITKRMRTAVAAGVLAVGMGWLALTGPRTEPERFPDADRAAAWMQQHLGPADRIWARSPWDAPVAFHLACRKMDPTLGGRPGPDGSIFVLVGPGDGQVLASVLDAYSVPDSLAGRFSKVEDWHRLEIFAAR